MNQPYVTITLLLAFSFSVARAEQPKSASGLSIHGTPASSVMKGEQGEYTLFEFKSDGNVVGIRIDQIRSKSEGSAASSWFKLLLESSSVTLRLVSPQTLMAEAAEKGGVFIPSTMLECSKTPAERDSTTNTYRLQCVAVEQDRRWLKDGKMVAEVSVVVSARHGSPADTLLLSNQVLTAWIE